MVDMLRRNGNHAGSHAIGSAQVEAERIRAAATGKTAGITGALWFFTPNYHRRPPGAPLSP